MRERGKGRKVEGRMGLCHTVVTRNLALIIMDNFLNMYGVL